MPIHVFVGAGPANLHRALKVRKLNPNAQIIILDRRLKPENHSIDRKLSRANIFRFEREDVTEKLINNGIDKQALDKLMHERKFSVAQGFQQGDDSVFAAKHFSQIQIRDLQQILLDTLFQQGNLQLIKQNLDLNDSISEQVLDIIKDLGLTDNDIQIHVATGALEGDSKKHEIIYPDQKKYRMENATPDVESMPVVPVHGTTTFFIKDKFEQEIISCNTLEQNQRSLDLSPWQKPLKQFGWNLIRPPRIRVFYANDILYIGAEIPIAMMVMEKKEFEEKVANYIRQIAILVFPRLPIDSLEANEVLRSRFPSGRGESGQVISSTTIELENQQKANVTIFNNGDSRYLPHYQTGSGFVTGFLQNEIYAEIYQHQTLKELFEWGQEKKHIDKIKDFQKYRTTYAILTNSQDEKIILRAAQEELYMALTRDVIEQNKEKVGKYFNALHQQTLTLMSDNFDELFSIFKNYHSTPAILPLKFSTKSDKTIAVLAMLKSGNPDFLRAILPRFLNDDISILTNDQLLNLRDAYFDDLKRNMSTAEGKSFNNFEIKAEFLVKLNKLNFTEILANYNQVHNTDYQESDFPEGHRLITLVEMLNLSKTTKGIAFIRNTLLPKLVEEDISQYTDEDILALKDQLTENYIDYIDVEQIATKILTQLDLNKLKLPKNALIKFNRQDPQENQVRLIIALAQENNTGLVELIIRQLNFPLINKKADQQAIGLRWAKALLIEKCSHPIEGYSIEADINKLIQCSDKKELVKRLKGVKEVLTGHKELHQRAALSFFKGKHSNTINEFFLALDKLVSQQDLTLETLQLEALNLLFKFHSKLKAGHSVRTIAVLKDAIINNKPVLMENDFTNLANI
ncbi:hypothetical protein [Legionella gresilensis]|uniref:hypothetical protein n=1 Tax=Legionella gresilensis TaxID=91823 RepID=UPI001040F1BA|nr:hypothetical protein [Legionella gresilensis]